MNPVGIVVVSHSSELASGVADLARQMAGEGVPIVPAGGGPNGDLGTDEDRVRAAISDADRGEGVLVLADIGSSLLTVRHLLERQANGHVRLADAPLVEGAVAAAVIASAGRPLGEVLEAAEEARGASKL
jgi:phosphoenolpyruvate---glycerone phosphotransferase subunit DhaM